MLNMLLVRKKRKERKQNKNITRGFNAFSVLCVFRGQLFLLWLIKDIGLLRSQG
jgi:hypothetical protein